MNRASLWVLLCFDVALTACWKPKHGPPEFLPATGAMRTKPRSDPSNDYAGAAVTLASAATLTAIDRKIYDVCYASCQPGTTCDVATGMCVRLPCGGKCPADYRCKVVDGKEACVLETPDVAKPSASSAPPARGVGPRVEPAPTEVAPPK